MKTLLDLHANKPIELKQKRHPNLDGCLLTFIIFLLQQMVTMQLDVNV